MMVATSHRILVKMRLKYTIPTPSKVTVLEIAVDVKTYLLIPIQGKIMERCNGCATDLSLETVKNTRFPRTSKTRMATLMLVMKYRHFLVGARSHLVLIDILSLCSLKSLI